MFFPEKRNQPLRTLLHGRKSIFVDVSSIFHLARFDRGLLLDMAQCVKSGVLLPRVARAVFFGNAGVVSNWHRTNVCDAETECLFVSERAAPK